MQALLGWLVGRRREATRGQLEELCRLREENSLLRAELLFLGAKPAERVEGLHAPLTSRHSEVSPSERSLPFPEVGIMPLPPFIPDVLQASQRASDDGSPTSSNTEVLEQLRSLGGLASLDRAMNAARRIRDVDYSLRSFHDDVAAAFPELGWYMVQRRAWHDPPHTRHDLPHTRHDPPHANEPTTSNALPEDEYRRTMGALFAVYWLARIGIDGERGFSFGVDGSWAANAVPAEGYVPEGEEREGERGGKRLGARGRSGSARRTVAGVPFGRMTEREKRLAFYLNTPWGKLERLMMDAGVLCRGEGFRGGEAGEGSEGSKGGERGERGELGAGGATEMRPGSAMTPTGAEEGEVCHRSEKSNEGEERQGEFRYRASQESDAGQGGEIRVVPDRMAALLVQTAIHDIMKVKNHSRTLEQHTRYTPISRTST
jgi:hypothetical protein